MAIEERTGERRGRPTTTQKGSDEIRQNSAEFTWGERTKDVAARGAGFSNREAYRQAAIVVNHAIPELSEMVDREEVSVSAAAKMCQLAHHKPRGRGGHSRAAATSAQLRGSLARAGQLPAHGPEVP